MTALDVYKTFQAVSLHFKSDYDAFEFGFRGPKIKTSNFQSRLDYYTYKKLGTKFNKREEIALFTLSNIIHNFTESATPSVYVKELSTEVYESWKSYFDSFTYNIKSELKSIGISSFDELMSTPHSYPILHDLFRSKKVSINFLVAINTLVDYVSDDSLFQCSDPLGDEEQLRFIIRKYTPFVDGFIMKHRKKLRDIFMNDLHYDTQK